jgi:hypothetical protein
LEQVIGHSIHILFLCIGLVGVRYLDIDDIATVCYIRLTTGITWLMQYWNSLIYYFLHCLSIISVDNIMTSCPSAHHINGISDCHTCVYYVELFVCTNSIVNNPEFMWLNTRHNGLSCQQLLLPAEATVSYPSFCWRRSHQAPGPCTCTQRTRLPQRCTDRPP